MDYKANYSGLEIYFDHDWHPMPDAETFQHNTQIARSDPIAEQVGRIKLPGSNPIG
jgi:hypothetical protein